MALLHLVANALAAQAFFVILRVNSETFVGSKSDKSDACHPSSITLPL